MSDEADALTKGVQLHPFETSQDEQSHVFENQR